VQYSCLPNEDGGIVDDLLVYRIDDKTYMLVVNASNIEKDWNWISKYNTEWRGDERYQRPHLTLSHARPKSCRSTCKA
jgi:glycine cleavage system aminomethyltransferase T